MPVAAQALISPQVAICRLIERNAAEQGLPVECLSRLLWVESGFDANATSPAGATGIAQFMPETASERGLRDTRDPSASITHAARLLAELGHRFGNLGLAAAAYNAGSGRLAKWLHGSSGLPEETRRYVRLVTGRPLDTWIFSGGGQEGGGPSPSCAAVILEFKRSVAVWRGTSFDFAPLFRVTDDGGFVLRSAPAHPLSATDRLKVHDLVARAAGISRVR